MDSRDILKQRKLLLQKQRDAILEHSRIKQEELAKEVKVKIGMDKFVSSTISNEFGKKSVGLKVPRSKEMPTVKPTCVDDTEDISPPAIKIAKLSTTKQKNSGDISPIEKLPNKIIKMSCGYFDGNFEKKFSLDAMLDDSIKELLLKCKFAYVALQCILPDALIIVKEGWILPMDATIRELAQEEIFRFLNTDTMNDSVSII